jgi:hypothetical protein
MNPKDQDPCGCVPRSRALVILPGSLPLDTTVPPDPDDTDDWPIVKPEPRQPPPG